MSEVLSRSFKACTPSAHDVPDRVIEGIWDRIEVGDPGECWEWKLSTASHGYGQIGWTTERRRPDGRQIIAGTTAHRVAWIAHTGLPIPAGMTIDHACRNRTCCNPHHLRMMSNLANSRDNGWAAGTHPRLAERDN